MPEIQAITGARETGKTFLCERLVENFLSGGLIVRGILSVKRIGVKGDRKIWARNIGSNEEREIAVFEPGWDVNFPKRDWRIDHENLDWANEIIKNSLPADIIIIDELGYLELEKDRGLVSSFDILKSEKYLSAFVVIRLSLIDAAKEMIQIDRVVKINQDTNIEITADKLSDHVLNRLIK